MVRIDNKKRSKAILVYICERDRQRGEWRERKKGKGARQGEEKEEVEDEGQEAEVAGLWLVLGHLSAKIQENLGDLTPAP